MSEEEHSKVDLQLINPAGSDWWEVRGEGHHRPGHLPVTLPVKLFKSKVTLTEAPLTVGAYYYPSRHSFLIICRYIKRYFEASV